MIVFFFFCFFEYLNFVGKKWTDLHFRPINEFKGNRGENSHFMRVKIIENVLPFVGYVREEVMRPVFAADLSLT